MIQYYSVKCKHTVSQMSQVCKTRKATVETILNQLEYVTKSHIAKQTIFFSSF